MKVENTDHIVSFFPHSATATGLFLPALKTRKKTQTDNVLLGLLCDELDVVLTRKVTQTERQLLSFHRQKNWVAEVSCGYHMFSMELAINPGVLNPPLLRSRQTGMGLGAVCFVLAALTQCGDAESAQFCHNEASGERPACDISRAAHRTLTFAAPGRHKTRTVPVEKEFSEPFLLTKAFISGKVEFAGIYL